MIRQAQASINYSALQHNFQRVRQLAPHSRIMAVIKAEGYGHGMLSVAKHLPQADAFAVACLPEAVALRQAGITQPITVLQGFGQAAACAMRRRAAPASAIQKGCRRSHAPAGRHAGSGLAGCSAAFLWRRA